MIGKKQLKEITETAKEKGYDVKIRDLAYVTLCENFEDRSIAYRVAYGEETLDVLAHDNKPEISYLHDYVKYGLDDGRGNAEAKANKMSFDENREEMVKLLKKTQDSMDEGLIEAKDALKIMADIRVKLNDKFNVNDRSQESLVIVEPKFNFVCPHTKRECYIATKENLMKKYNLVEKIDNE